MNNTPEYLIERDKIYSKDDVTDYQILTKHSEGVKVCQACGKLFIPKNGRQKFCLRTHYKKCVICGNDFNLNLANGIKLQPATCSTECRNKYRAYISKTPEVVEKSKQTNLQKYGVENGAQSDQARKKIHDFLVSKATTIELTCAICGKKIYSSERYISA